MEKFETISEACDSLGYIEVLRRTNQQELPNELLNKLANAQCAAQEVQNSKEYLFMRILIDIHQTLRDIYTLLAK